MERCERCRAYEDEVQLYDAIYEGQVAFLCERCSIIENIPILNKPTEERVRESEKLSGVYERMKKIAGIPEPKKQDDLLNKNRLIEIENNPSLESPKEQSINLIEHFHWEIMKNRRRKGLSQKQLGEQIGEPEFSIEMLEKAMIPKNPENIIIKLERFFHIKLKKIDEIDLILKKPEEKPILLDEFGNSLELIQEPKIESEENNEPIIELEDFEKENFDFSKINANKVKISDLMKLHREKIIGTEQEKTQEQKKIQERQKIIEARKEELITKKQKESKELNDILGGIELLKKDIKEEDSSLLQ